MPFTPAQQRGATSLLRDGLRLSAGDRLLLLYQDIVTDAAKCIMEAAAALRVDVDSRTFNRTQFRNGFPEAFSGDRIPEPVPRGIALIMEWSEATTKGRLMLLKHLQNTGKPWRVASMPGVDLDGLASCSSDFQDIREKCRDTFAVLARATMCRLCTLSPSGEQDELRIPTGDYCPMISTGEIPEGSWGNFPSGETFTLPNPYRASGTVTLRGSFPNYPLAKDEWVRFELKRGRILYSSLSASSESLRKEFGSYFFTPSGRPKSCNSNSLAELGIGTNRCIERLSGKPIFDEKKINTIHIAFGSNNQFNGPLNSKAHHDLTCVDATLLAGDTIVVRKGRYALASSRAIRDLDDFGIVPPSNSHLTPGTSVLAELHNGDLTITYTPYRGDNASFTIAHGATAQLAQKILDIVAQRPGVTVEGVGGQLGTSFNAGIITGLLEYRILEAKNEKDHFRG